ncbi:hypothetical protein BBJ28_00001580 [Nothophytophthora sp. Chile5]|nr:hypothetical protein BBJ28_00001580 [Nothophytophthora sp. Chile5]
MDYLEKARRAPWVVVYVVAGLGMLANLLGDAYWNAVAVCEMYPHFAFSETLREELAMHHTRLPLVRVHVPTLQLLAAYAAAYVVRHWGILERAWPVLVDVLSGRWLYRMLLPYVFSEPGVPELLSEDEAVDDDDDDDDVYFGDAPAPPVDAAACSEALAKLVQVKMQHANRTIPRPDDWLVFDPVQEDLVLQKNAKLPVQSNGSSEKRNGTAGKLSLAREQEPLGDTSQQRPLPAAAARQKRPKEATPTQQQDVAMAIKKRL